MQKVEGNKIQEDIKDRLRQAIVRAEIRPRLTLVYIGEDPVIDTYVELKRAFGEDIGVHVDVDRYPSDLSKERVVEIMSQYMKSEESDGIVLQLPLPSHLDVDSVVSDILPDKDVDVLGKESLMRALKKELPLPPVVGAVDEIFKKYEINPKGKKIVIVGRGRLVGKPLSLWLLSQGCHVMTLEKGDEVALVTRSADIIISGAGEPHFITPDMVKEGVVLIDAGTSDVEGEKKGDIHPDTFEKSSIYSSVPGGVGPITVAKLFENLLVLKKVL